MIRTALLLLALAVTQAADTAAFLAAAKAPISPRAVGELAKKHLGAIPPADSLSAVGMLPDAVVFHLDAQVNLVLEFPPGRPADTSADSIDEARVVRVARLADAVGPIDDLPDVLAVHDAPPIGLPFRGDRLYAAAARLHAAGAERALAACERYLQIARPAGAETDDLQRSLRRRSELGWNETRVHLLARLLFAPRPGSKPWRPPALGAPVPACRDPLALPLFPLAVIDGLPLLTVGGYDLNGEAEPAAVALAYARDACALVASLPAPAADPIAVADHFAADAQVREAYTDVALAEAVTNIRLQVLAIRAGAEGGAPFTALGYQGSASHLNDDATRWLQAQGLAAAAPLRWDAASGRFVPAR